MGVANTWKMEEDFQSNVGGEPEFLRQNEARVLELNSQTTSANQAGVPQRGKRKSFQIPPVIIVLALVLLVLFVMQRK